MALASSVMRVFLYLFVNRSYRNLCVFFRNLSKKKSYIDEIFVPMRRTLIKVKSRVWHDCLLTSSSIQESSWWWIGRHVEPSSPRNFNRQSCANYRSKSFSRQASSLSSPPVVTQLISVIFSLRRNRRATLGIPLKLHELRTRRSLKLI